MFRKDEKKDTKQVSEASVAKTMAAADKRADKRQAKRKADKTIAAMQDVLSGIGVEKKVAIEARLREII